jgi:hypothetical protein
MISKLSTFVVFAVAVCYVASAAVVPGSPKSSEISANHLRAMAARNKRASMAILPGRLRYDEQAQRRSVLYLVETKIWLVINIK